MVGLIVFVNETSILTSCVENQLLLTSKLQKTRNKLPSLTSEYAEDGIFNADESGVYYRQLPTRYLIEKGKTCKGGKKIERTDYCFVVLQCTGGGGLKPHVIGNAARPRAFKMNNVKLDDLHVIWRYIRRG
jgi:hypothetical protein